MIQKNAKANFFNELIDKIYPEEDLYKSNLLSTKDSDNIIDTEEIKINLENEDGINYEELKLELEIFRIFELLKTEENREKSSYIKDDFLCDLLFYKIDENFNLEDIQEMKKIFQQNYHKIPKISDILSIKPTVNGIEYVAKNFKQYFKQLESFYNIIKIESEKAKKEGIEIGEELTMEYFKKSLTVRNNTLAHVKSAIKNDILQMKKNKKSTTRINNKKIEKNEKSVESNYKTNDSHFFPQYQIERLSLKDVILRFFCFK